MTLCNKIRRTCAERTFLAETSRPEATYGGSVFLSNLRTLFLRMLPFSTLRLAWSDFLTFCVFVNLFFSLTISCRIMMSMPFSLCAFWIYSWLPRLCCSCCSLARCESSRFVAAPTPGASTRAGTSWNWSVAASAWYSPHATWYDWLAQIVISN